MGFFVKKTDMKVLVIGFFWKVIKIALNDGAKRELELEAEAIKKASENEIYAPYVPRASKKGRFLFMEMLKPASEEMIVLFFSDHKDLLYKPEKPLKELIEYETLLNFLNENQISPDFYKKYLEETKFPSSPSHGDFHQGNIMQKKGKLYFIDWSHFKEESSFIFDFYDYHVVGDGSSPWFESVLNYLDENMPSISTIKIDTDTIISYSIWKSAKELRALNTYGKLSESKVEKYKKILTLLPQKADQ